MRAPFIGAVCLAGALIAEAFAAAPNSAHICGDTRLSSRDQMDCRAQMESAKTESERLKVQHNFEKLSTTVASPAAPPRSVVRRAADPAPLRGTSPTPSDSYPPAVAKAPVYPGEAPMPQTGRPPA